MIAVPLHSPTTEAEWRHALAAVHPDRIGESEQFLELVKARAVWRQSHGCCVWCGKSFRPKKGTPSTPQARFCGGLCRNQWLAQHRLKPRQLENCSQSAIDAMRARLAARFPRREATA